MSFCASCGRQLGEGAEFCAGCGTPVSGSEQATSHPVPAGSNSAVRTVREPNGGLEVESTATQADRDKDRSVTAPGSVDVGSGGRGHRTGFLIGLAVVLLGIVGVGSWLLLGRSGGGDPPSEVVETIPGVAGGTYSVVSPDGSGLYVDRGWPGPISVINTANNSLATAIPFDDASGLSMELPAMIPNGSSLFVPNSADGTVSVIDMDSNTVATTIPVGDSPCGAVALPDGSAVYVPKEDGTVSVIDTASTTVTATIRAEVSCGRHHGHAVEEQGKMISMIYPLTFGVLPDGSAVYIPNEDGTMSVIDTKSDTLATTINLGTEIREALVLPDGSAVYVPTPGGTISVIDTSDNSVTATIPLFSPDEFSGGAATSVMLPDGSAVYVALNDHVYVIDTSSESVTRVVPVGRGPSSPFALPNGSAVYVPNFSDGTVSVIDTETGTVSSTIAVGSHPYRPVGLPDGSAVYVPSNGDGTLTVIGQS